MRTNSSESDSSFIGTARRVQITQATIEVLAAEGYTGTTMAVIAGRLGVSKGILSYHFASKAELLQAVVRFVLSEAGEWMEQRMHGAASFRGALHSYISANLSYLDSHRTEIRALTEVLANARATEGVPELFAASQAQAVHALEALFDGGRRAGEFGDVPSRILAVSLRATIDSTSESLRSDPAFDLSEFERELLQLFDRAAGQYDQITLEGASHE
ncbi:TetR/AcrR family transcriptional regulator [Leifsonia sp. NPDC058230]|uniref:TetR/AcrR family transcriptional regulator n=1 Tax=Leifsonia sp. NPDC058230 TaxID=3346391 RepID=UPI0036DDB76E